MSSFSISMRAVVFLCLLHATNGLHFKWPGDEDTPASDPTADNACSLNPLSCGCCMMVQKMEMLKRYFQTTLNKLEDKYMTTNEALNTIEGNRVAFSVSLYTGNVGQCYSSMSNNNIIIYKNVFFNLGGAYSADTGVFAVPHAGVYSLAVNIYSDAGAAGNMLKVCANLQVNGRAIAGARDKNDDDQEDSAIIFVALQLKIGDNVTVNIGQDCFICDKNYYNTFTAFLLYATG